MVVLTDFDKFLDNCLNFLPIKSELLNVHVSKLRKELFLENYGIHHFSVFV